VDSGVLFDSEMVRSSWGFGMRKQVLYLDGWDRESFRFVKGEDDGELRYSWGLRRW
jgi:hypothetical protein